MFEAWNADVYGELEQFSNSLWAGYYAAIFQFDV